MHFFIHNSFHAGDVILTRPLIRALKEQFPDLVITLECRSSYRYLWEDLGLSIVNYEGDDHTTTIPTPNCPTEALFINLWFGLYLDILGAFSLTYPNNIYTFNRQMVEKHLDQLYRLTVPAYPPPINFDSSPEIPVPIRENGILIENGAVRSGQNYFPINNYLEYIAKTYPCLVFYCSAKPPCELSNLIDCSSFNLIQLSELSNHCQAFVTLGSGVNAATYTEANRFKPRCLVGLAQLLRIWDDTHNPVLQVNGISDVLKFLNRVSRHQQFALPTPVPNGFNPQQMCKFLKSRSEVDECSCYLYEHGYVSHALPCKNWEIAHIIAELGDGNLLDMGSTDSYILKNAVRKKTQGCKYGIDLRSPDVPQAEIIYLEGDLLATPLPDNYFQYVTCLSVIEHEVDFENFAAEASRLLVENGKLYITFDYWIPKISTSLKLYHRRWQPLDDWDVLYLKSACEANNLRLTDEIDWTLGEQVIKPGYFSPHPEIGYTFGMLTFEKCKVR